MLMASAEVAPFAKVGGLADVVGSLPKSLVRLGCDARIAMPAYRMAEDLVGELAPKIAEFKVQISETWSKTAYVRAFDHDGVTIYFIGTDEWFHEADRSESIYRLGIDQYLFFSSAVLQLGKEIGWLPDVIHCHDWHTGFIPVMLRHSPFHQSLSTSSIFTIHNLAYQGEFDLDVLDRLSLPHWLFSPDFVEAFGRVNFLKAGAAFSDLVTTVSPHYAEEIQTPEYGARLEGLMHYLSGEGRLEGVLNGIDLDTFNPETDRNIPCHFSADHQNGKALCKDELIRLCGFLPGPEPIYGIVSRMSTQKGLDLVIDSAEHIAHSGAKLVVLGAGEPHIVEGMTHVARRHPNHIKFFEGYRETLASVIYAGSDAFLMPSRFEPCGLGQMIAMRYGTIPIVRSTGGLADTVKDGVNGLVFSDMSQVEFMSALDRFHLIYRSQNGLHNLRERAMKTDWGWSQSALQYLGLYRQVSEKKALAAVQIA